MSLDDDTYTYVYMNMYSTDALMIEPAPILLALAARRGDGHSSGGGLLSK